MNCHTWQIGYNDMKFFTISLLVSTFCVGCAAPSNIGFVKKGAIEAQGNVKKDRLAITRVTLDCRAMDASLKRTLFVGFFDKGQLRIDEITPSALEHRSAKKLSITRDDLANLNSYHVDGYVFDFQANVLVKIAASQWGWNKNGSKYTLLGSADSGRTLQLPCSVEEFTGVFGAPDNIKKGFGW